LDGQRDCLPAGKPYISKLALDNTRKGFFEREQFDAVLKRVPDDLKPLFETAYITGWRVHDELLTRQRHHVDLKARWLRLEPGETKNRKGRNFPLTPRLRKSCARKSSGQKPYSDRKAKSSRGCFIAMVSRLKPFAGHGLQPAWAPDSGLR
jgi:integrase